MARNGKGFGGKLVDTGARLVTRAAEKVLSDPRGQDAVARAIGLAQRSRRRVEEVQERLMRAAGIPGRQDYQDLAKQLARLKRKAREISQKLDREAEEGAAEGVEDGASGEGRTRH
jgi:hypothetical protein